MFETYAALFNQRGHLYHQAMKDFPDARKAEFNAVVSWLDLKSGMSICDVPSGGGYLSDFILDNNITFNFVETSQVFANAAKNICDNNEQKNDNNKKIYNNISCDSITNIPLEASIIDRVISLSGLHHESDTLGFYKEANRLLTDEGFLVLADVMQGSGVDTFLNQFVDQHSSMGHEGRFFCAQTLADIESCGFEIVDSSIESYTWHFSSSNEMVNYCKMLFGIDQAVDKQILEGIRNSLGYAELENTCLMNWELMFIKASKKI